MAGGAPSGEDLGVVFIDPAENGVKSFEGGLTRAQGDGDGSGGSGAVAIGGALAAFAGDEVEDHGF